MSSADWPTDRRPIQGHVQQYHQKISIAPAFDSLEL